MVLFSSRNRTAPARQQTLRAAMEWSHGFLDERERTVFRRLAVFTGSGSPTMIQQVVADPAGEGELDEWAVLDMLTLLVDPFRRMFEIDMDHCPKEAASAQYPLMAEGSPSVAVTL